MERGSADPVFRVCGFSSLSAKKRRPWEAGLRYTCCLSRSQESEVRSQNGAR